MKPESVETTPVTGRENQGNVIRTEHPMATDWFNAVPCLRHVPLFGPVTSTFGPKFSLSLGLCYAFSKGGASSIINRSRQPMFMERYGVSAARYQRLTSMYSLGWSLKPFLASITDALAFLGYTKRWYMAISALAGTAFALGYALLPGEESSANAAAAFIFLTCFCKANIDILSEGHFSRSMRERPESGTSVVSWVWAMTYLGTIISACMMGPLADQKKTYIGIIVSAVLQAITIPFFVFNLYGEKKNQTNRRKDVLLEYRARERARRANHTAEGEVVEPFQSSETESNAVLATTQNWADSDDGFQEPNIRSCLCNVFEINMDIVKDHWRPMLFTLVMTCGIITIACVNVLGTSYQLLYTCIAVLVVFFGGAFLALPVMVAKAAIFIYLNSMLYLQIPGALANFYRASPACLPDGPHFSYSFYITVGGLITDVGAIAGAILFAYLFSKQRYPLVFILTTFLQALGSIFDLVIVKRWNIYIGIPDHAMYILGDAIVYEICFMLSMIPAQILMSRLCPRGTETIGFAIMAGFNSSGNSMSLAIASMLMEWFWPVKASLPCDFSNVPYLIITGHLCLPLLVIPLAFFLLPNTRICDPIAMDKVSQLSSSSHEDELTAVPTGNRGDGLNSETTHSSALTEPSSEGHTSRVS